MASSYSPLKVELIGTGEQAGTWGTTTNTNLGTALEEAITGRATATFPSDANFTLPYIDSNAAQVFRNLVLNVTSSGNLSATRDLIIPAIEKQYIVENNTSGSQSIRVKTAAGTGVTIPAGRIATVFCDGTNTRFADDFVDINGGTIDGTPIGAASASTGAFTTATITTATISGGTINNTSIGATTPSTGAFSTVTISGGTINNTSIGATTPSTGAFSTATITTGNITTGNINTLTVGTQTNKATISYTTNTARTLTIPNVGGNRTFSFLDEAQTFTANQTIAGNLNFSGNARRITGNFSSYPGPLLPITGPITDRVIFQTNVTNDITMLTAIPNGTDRRCGIEFYDKADPTNASRASVYIDDDEVSFYSAQSGTGDYKSLYLVNGGFYFVELTPTGELAMSGLADVNVRAKFYAAGKNFGLEATGGVRFTDAYGKTVGATNRSLFIDNTGEIGGLSSTRESKTNIAPIADADWLMSLEPVSYNRRERDKTGAYTDEYNPSTEFGLIADDAANIRPEICVFVDGKVSGINYEQLIAPMLKEIQKLRAEVDALKEKLNG
jgi:hypothetical protein